jgi:hypothetical protein
MPPVIARSLLEGTPAFELTRNYATATIAFIALEDFKSISERASDPTAVIGWLHAVYAAFDALVDAYRGRVNKVTSAFYPYFRLRDIIRRDPSCTPLYISG